MTARLRATVAAVTLWALNNPATTLTVVFVFIIVVPFLMIWGVR